MSQREKQCLEDDGYDDDGDTVVAHIAVEELEGVEQRLGQDREPSQVKGLLQVVTLGLEDIDILRADKQALRHGDRLACIDGNLRGADD